jgi:hypothetical protein
MMIQGKQQLQSYSFAVIDHPFCIWGWNLQEENLQFLRNIDHEYFLYLAKVHSQNAEGENKGKATIALRMAYYHGLETMFALIFAAIQSPRCVLPWILKAKPWQIRELAKTVGDSNFRGYLRFKLEKPTWDDISNLIHNLVFKDLSNREQLAKSFASLWQRFAREYTDQLLVDEYNSVKHGFRANLGGIKFSFAPSEDSKNMPSPESYISLCESQLGSSFYIPEQIVGSPEKEARSDPHFWLKLHHVNSHPARLDLALRLVSISINNVRAFLRIVQNDRKEPGIKFLHPMDEKEFTAPWENRESLLNFTEEQAVQEQQIERLDADEILKLLKVEK